ncbi:unnamed protein product [Ixodes pacificus]
MSRSLGSLEVDAVYHRVHGGDGPMHDLRSRFLRRSWGVLGAWVVVRHVQELGVDVSRALPFGVEDELVVAAVRADGCWIHRGEKPGMSTIMTLLYSLLEVEFFFLCYVSRLLINNV